MQNERILKEIAETQSFIDLLDKKRKELQSKLRANAKARFYGIDRRQLIEPGRAMSVDEFAATTGKFRDQSGNRTCRNKLIERGVFIDPDFDLVMTDDFLECQMEHVRQCRANESD